MSRRRFRRIEELFYQALDQPAAEREQWLHRECVSTPSLETEVRALLESVEEPHPLLALDGTRHPLATEPVTRLDPPASIGPYRVLRELGRGGMSTVYLVERGDREFRRQVALKVIRPDQAVPSLLRRLREEQRILARLSHPHIARLYDGGTTEEGVPYLVMEAVEGVPLDRYAREEKPPLDQLLRLVLAVCEAVAYAHQSLVIHRDLKPGNILVSEAGEPKLLDFGIAKLLEPEALERGEGDGDSEDPGPDGRGLSTRASLRLMTPGYASPEQIRGEAITTATDVYSLGVVLYELLTGELPHSRATLAGAALGGEPPIPSLPSSRAESFRRRLAGDLDSIVLKALAWEPTQRYSSVRDLAADLERFLEGRPVEARRPSLGQRLDKWVRRNPVTSAAALALVVMTSVAAVLLLLYSLQAAKQRDQARADKVRAEDMASFLTEIFRVTDDSGDRVSARQLLERGAERIAGELSLDPLRRAELLEALGKAHRNLGLFDQADRLLRQALGLRRDVLGPEDPSSASAFYQLGFMQVETGDYVEAEENLRRALRLQRRGGDKRAEGLTLGQLAWIVGVGGNLKEALALQRQGLGLLSSGVSGQQRGVDFGRAEALNRMGIFYSQQHKTREAEAHFRQAVIIDRRLPGQRQARSTMFLRNLAGVLIEMGELEEAESLQRESLDIALQLYGEKHPSVAGAYQKMGTLLHEKAEHGEAEKHFLKALAMRRELLGTEHPRVGWSLQALGALYRDMGREAEAVEAYRESIANLSAALPDSHLTASAMADLGALFRAQGKCPEAEGLLQRSLALSRKTQPANSPLILRAEESLRLCGIS